MDNEDRYRGKDEISHPENLINQFSSDLEFIEWALTDSHEPQHLSFLNSAIKAFQQRALDYHAMILKRARAEVLAPLN